MSRKMKLYRITKREFENELDNGTHLVYSTEDEHGNLYAIDSKKLALFSNNTVIIDTVEAWEQMAKNITELITLGKELKLAGNPLIMGRQRMSRCEICGQEFPYNKIKKYCSCSCQKRAEYIRKRDYQLKSKGH